MSRVVIENLSYTEALMAGVLVTWCGLRSSAAQVVYKLSDQSRKGQQVRQVNRSDPEASISAIVGRALRIWESFRKGARCNECLRHTQIADWMGGLGRMHLPCSCNNNAWKACDNSIRRHRHVDSGPT